MLLREDEDELCGLLSRTIQDLEESGYRGSAGKYDCDGTLHEEHAVSHRPGGFTSGGNQGRGGGERIKADFATTLLCAEKAFGARNQMSISGKGYKRI
jgi:hypothetical protein